MASAVIDQVSVDIAVDDGRTRLRATGSTIAFDGFLALYQEDRDDPEDEDGSGGRLPALSENEAVNREQVEPNQHFTQPPPRYTEASLVKKMEELGIGRPSTYASILQVLQDRDYVRLEKRRFLPEDRGRLVTAFLKSFFDRYVEYDFTAELEEQLDEISDGRIDWKKVLSDFWAAFNHAVGETKDLSITNVIDALDEALGPHFFPVDPEKPEKDPRLCPACGSGRLGLRLGRTGGFIGCSNYPECRHTRSLAVEGDAANGLDLSQPKVLGLDPESDLKVTLRKGPYGLYLQLGEGNKENKPRRSSLPKGWAPEDLTLERALGLLALPRVVGPHPEDGEPVTAGLGRFGPYVRHGNTYRSLGDGDDVLVIGLNRAVALIAEAPRRASKARALGDHPEDGKPVTQGSGRYGPYVKHGRLYASLPKASDPAAVTLEEAVALLAAQAEKKKGKGRRQEEGARQKGHGEENAEKESAKEGGKEGHTEKPNQLGQHGLNAKPKHGKGRRGGLPSVTVIDIVALDDSGEAVARPARWDDDAPPPRIRVRHGPGSGAAPAVGDRALARMTKEAPERYRADIIRRLPPQTRQLLGVFERGAEGPRLRPIERGSRHDYLVREDKAVPAEPGVVYRAEVIEQRHRHLGLKTVRLLERIAAESDPGAFSLLAIFEQGIPLEFPTEALQEAQAAGAADAGGREDLRRLPLVTIDGADARDFDDAVFAEPDPDGDSPQRVPIPGAGIWWWRSPTSPGTCAPAAPWIGLRRPEETRSTFPIASCPCCPRRSPTAGAHCCPAPTGPAWRFTSGSTARARSSATASPARSCIPTPA